MYKILEKLKDYYRNNTNRITILFGFKRVYDLLKFKFLSDRTFIKLSFRMSHGYNINLKNPKTLNEKIQWLKLYDRTSLHTQCADKYRVRGFVEDKIGKEYLIPLYFFTENPKDINYNNLKNLVPCIVKTNHDSSGGIIFRSLSNQNWEKHQNRLTKNLKRNYYITSKEWQYKNIKRGIVVEKLLLDINGEIPFDYKVHCFNGKPKIIQVDLNRETANYSRNWYTIEWEKAPFGWYSEKNGKVIKGKNVKITKPNNLSEMLRLSENLSSNFIYTRIDWYSMKGKLFFGEITFHHDSGLRPFEPKKWDFILGEKLDLSLLKENK